MFRGALCSTWTCLVENKGETVNVIRHFKTWPYSPRGDVGNKKPF